MHRSQLSFLSQCSPAPSKLAQLPLALHQFDKASLYRCYLLSSTTRTMRSPSTFLHFCTRSCSQPRFFSFLCSSLCFYRLPLLFRSSFRPDSGLVRVHFGPSPRQRPLTRSLLRVASSRCLGASVPRLRPSMFGSLAVLSIVSRNINNNSYGAQQGFQQPAQQNSGSYNGQGY